MIICSEGKSGEIIMEKGEELLDEVAGATGLPIETITKELSELIHAAGYENDSVTLDQLRHALAEYVQDILLAAKEDLQSTDKQN